MKNETANCRQPNEQAQKLSNARTRRAQLCVNRFIADKVDRRNEKRSRKQDEHKVL